jgi:hypothetical protein
MGCNCSGTNTLVYQVHIAGKKPVQYATRDDAQTALAKAGGKGTIIRTTARR